MAVQTVEKRCNDCGVNVADRPRTKDQAGRYFCDPCWQSRLAEKAVPPRTSPSLGSPTQKRTHSFGLADQPSDDALLNHDLRRKPGRLIAAAITAVACLATVLWAVSREAPRRAAESSQQGVANTAALQAARAAAVKEVAGHPKEAFRRFASTVVDELNNNMGALLARLHERSSKDSATHTLDNDRPLNEQLPDWPDKTVILPSFKYDIQEPDGVLPLAGELHVTRRNVSDLGTKDDSGKIKWEKATSDSQVRLRFVWEDEFWKLKSVEDDEKNSRVNLELWLELEELLSRLPNPSPVDVTSHAVGEALGEVSTPNSSSLPTRTSDQDSNPSIAGISTLPQATAKPATPAFPPVPIAVDEMKAAPPVIDLSNRDSTDAALVVSHNGVTEQDQLGARPTNTTLVHANDGQAFKLIKKSTTAEGLALLAADRLFGESDVLLLHPQSQEQPCVVDFSRMTRTSKGILTFRFHNMPGGDCIASAGSATSGFTDIAVTADQWIPLDVPFDHEDVVLRVQATGWFCEHAFTTYAFSTEARPPAARVDAASQPPLVVAKTPPEPITAQQIAERRTTLVAAFDSDIAKLQRLWAQLPPSARTDESSIGLKLSKLKAARAAEVAHVGSIPDAKIAADIQHDRDRIAAEKVGADNAASAAAAHIAEWQNVQDQIIGNTTIPAADIVNWRQTRLNEIDRQLAAYEAKNPSLRNPAYKADLESQRKDLLAMTVGDVASRLYDKVHFAHH